MISLKNNPEFYKSLAHLFYALVVADRNVEKVEKVVVHGLIQQHWSVMSEELEIDQLLYATLKKLFKNKSEKEDAFQVFKQFFLENQELFNDEMKEKIMDSANRIVNAFSGVNKSESVLISRLFFLMN